MAAPIADLVLVPMLTHPGASTRHSGVSAREPARLRVAEQELAFAAHVAPQIVQVQVAHAYADALARIPA